MSDPRVADDILMNLAVVRGNLQQVWRSVDELRAYARGAERALDDVEVETSRARLTTDPAIGAVSLRNAGDQLDVLRQRCALSSSMAEEVEERLGVAKRHVEFARDRIEHYDPGRATPRTPPPCRAYAPKSRTSQSWSTSPSRWPREPARTCARRPRPQQR